jgi:hypothetical protein
LKDEWIAAIFDKCRIRWGNQWTAKFGGGSEEDVKLEIGAHMSEWAEVLADLSPEQIRHGIERLDDEAPKFPPNVMEFKQLCRQQQSTSDPIHCQHKALPQPKASNGTGLHWCAAMRAGIRNNTATNAKRGIGSNGQGRTGT